MRTIPALCAGVLLSGCLAVGTSTPEGRSGDHLVQTLLKNDANKLTELSLLACRAALRELMRRLYRRNPEQLQAHHTAEENERRLFDRERRRDVLESGSLGADAIRRSLDPAYRGDRVYAYVAGLLHMVHLAYGGKSEFYFYTSPSAQLLHDSARNIEIAAWRLASMVGPEGRPLLLSDSLPHEPRNHGFARLFGKLIATQDNLARFFEARGDRLVRRVIRPLGSAVFLPL